MIAAAAALLTLVGGAAWWRPLARPAPVPDHVLRGGSGAFNLALSVALGAVFAAKLGAVPAVVAVGHATDGTRGAVGAAAALATVLAGLGAWSRRRPRSCAEPLREEAAWFGSAALVAAATGAWGGLLDARSVVVAVAGGGVATVAAVACLAAGFWWTWGRNPRFAVMRRHDFRILGDNPDALTVIARVRVVDGGSGLRVRLPRVAEGPVTFTVYDGRMRALAGVTWDELRGPLEAGDGVDVVLGPDGPRGSGFRVPLVPGRYLVSVRNYRPWRRDVFPTVEVAT